MTFVVGYISLSLGVSNLSFSQVIEIIFKKPDTRLSVVIWNLRLPRVLTDIVAGASLGICGCVMQSNLKNQLASPSTLGVTNAAAFGANIAIIAFGAGTLQSGQSDAVKIVSPYLVTVCAFIFSILSVLIIMGLSKINSFSPDVIVLAGVAISSIFGAGITFLQYFSNETHLAAAVFWTFGNPGRVSWNELYIMTGMLIVSIIYFMLKSWDYNAMLNGEDTAKSLGVNTESVVRGAMLFSSLLIATTVSFLGIISFVGLIAPQISRRFIGNDHRYLIPSSAILGSLILTISDTFGRVIVSPVIIPVGVITSFLGAPLFLSLIHI